MKDFLEKGGKRADLEYDYERGYLSLLEHDALVLIVDPTLAMATLANFTIPKHQTDKSRKHDTSAAYSMKDIFEDTGCANYTVACHMLYNTGDM